MEPISKPSLFLLIFALIFLAACQTNQPEAIPTTPTTLPDPTPEPSPTVLPRREIIPEVMPTTYPNQKEIIAEEGEVDFVIDWAALEQPTSNMLTSENWFLYTAPDSSFSVIMRGKSIPIEEQHTIELDSGDILPVNIVRTDTWNNQFAVSYSIAPDLASGGLTAEEYLDSFTFDILTTESGGDFKIIEQEDIEQIGFPGRDYTVEFTPEDKDFSFLMRFRLYIVRDRVYQLTIGGLDEEKMFGEHGSRFLDSFTINSR